MAVTYLMYHELGRPGRPLCDESPGYRRYVVQGAAFLDQLDQISGRGMRAVNVGDALTAPEQSTVVVTFDDGCETDLLMAAPALQARGFGATFYITTGFLGARGYLTRAQLRYLADAGFEIGCHGATHRFLSDLPPDQVTRELTDPKAQLEDITGRAIVHFSCPGGRWDPRVADAARLAGYASVATSRPGINSNDTNPFNLARVPVMSTTTLAQFDRLCRWHGTRLVQFRTAILDAAKTSLGNETYDRLRAMLLGVRQ